MNRPGSAANCGADPHAVSRLSLIHAAIEVLENRRLLSGSHDYIWKEAENFDGARLAADLHRWDAFSYAGFNGSGVRAMENDKGKYEFSSAVSSARLDYVVPGQGNIVGAAKRIGPYPDAATRGVGNNDESVLRDHAENLW